MNPTETQDTEDTDEIALRWLARLRGARLAAAEQAEFERWLAASPAHRMAFRRAESLWSASGEAGAAVAAEEAPALGAYLDAIEEHRRHRRTTRRATGALVLCVGLLAAGGVWLERPHLFQDLLADHVAPRGARLTVTLADGSTALLDADSALDEQLTSSERHVRLLRGSAFFSVRKSPTPFVVETSDGSVTALGTSFDVRIEDGTRVTLATGRVAVEPAETNTHPLILEPGEAVRFDADRADAVATVDLAEAMAWHEGRFVFYETRLVDVVAQIARYRAGRIVITDGDLAGRRVSGSFSLDHPDAALASLQATVGFTMDSIFGRLIVLR